MTTSTEQATHAAPATEHTRMTFCANCDETIERQWTPQQGWDRLLHSPRTYEGAEALGIAEPAGQWVHFQTGEVACV